MIENPQEELSLPGPGAAAGAEMPRSGSTTERIGRNTAINLAGSIFPLFLSLLTVPAYLHLIGQARYGFLAVVWVVLGYFGVFDLGLSKATANQMARMRDESAVERQRVFWTALAMNAGLGVVGGVLLLGIGKLLLHELLHVSPALRAEAAGSLPWLALAVPLTTVTLVLAGALEGHELFFTVNTLSTIGLALFQLSPFVYAYWVGPNLAGLIAAATIGLAVSTVITFVVTMRSLSLRSRPQVDRARLPALLRYGGWITVTSLVAPFMTAIDRVFIGSILGTRAVTQYTVPLALVSRIQILSGSLARSVFPRFSRLDAGDATDVSRQSLTVLVAAMTTGTVVAAVLLDPFLRLWIGSGIAAHSAPVGEILLIGIWFNALAIVPFAFLWARGRPDLPAKFHLVEVAPYIGGLVLALHLDGIRGAAWAWTARAAVDAVLLFWGARRISSGSSYAEWGRVVQGGILATMACVASLTVFHTPAARAVLGCALVAVSLVWAWRAVAASEDFRRATSAALRRAARLAPVRSGTR